MSRPFVAFALASALALFVSGVALAVPPSLTSVGQQDRHPSATFYAPQADFVSIYFATKPGRATDGSFLSENVEHSDSFTDDEIQAGRWLDSSRIDPGTYYVMLRASPDFSACYVSGTGAYSPACADGYSNIVTFTIPTPTTIYRASADMLRSIRIGYMKVTADRLGIDQPYDLCYRTKTGKKKCVKGTLDGYSWDDDVSDTLRISLNGLSKRTKFTWYARGTTKVLASRTVNTA